MYDVDINELSPLWQKLRFYDFSKSENTSLNIIGLSAQQAGRMHVIVDKKQFSTEQNI